MREIRVAVHMERETETTEKGCLLVCSLWPMLSFFIQTRGGTAHIGLGPPTTNSNQENATGQSDKDSSIGQFYREQLKVPLLT